MQVGDKIPVATQLANYDASQFPRAYVTDATGVAITGSPFNLTADDASGSYSNTTAIMPNTPWVRVLIKVYTDSGHTTLSGSAGGVDYEVFLTSTGTGSLPVASNITGFVQNDNCNLGPLEDTIVKGSARSLTVRLVESQFGNPFDISDATLVEFRFRKSDGTVLSLLSTDAGSPVQIVSGEGGKLLCVLTATQTALLAAMSPAPFVIKVTRPAGATVVNLPTQLSVEERDV